MNWDKFTEELAKEFNQDKYADLFLAVFEQMYKEDVLDKGIAIEEVLKRMADMSAYMLRASLDDMLKRILKHVDTK
jgi:hypothetical protein